MKALTRWRFVFTLAATTGISSSVHAVTYDVDRSFLGATLTGTVDVPVGDYTIQNQGAHPITSVNLNLTVNDSSYNLVNVFTDVIMGTGQFFIYATPTTLTFDTADFGGANPADLVFSETDLSGNRYAIGSDLDPGFEIAFTDAGNTGGASVTFPTVFGTAVPEPTTLAGLGLLGVGLLRRKRI